MQWFSKVALPLPPNHPPSFKNLGLGKGSQNKSTPTKFTSLILSPCYYSDSYIPCTKLNTIHVLEFKCTKKGFFTGLHNFPYILFIY